MYIVRIVREDPVKGQTTTFVGPFDTFPEAETQLLQFERLHPKWSVYVEYLNKPVNPRG